MRGLHVLCEDGITAELWVGALIDAGVPVPELQAAIDSARLPVELEATSGLVREVSATTVTFAERGHELVIDSPSLLSERIDQAGLPERARTRALSLVDRLARAEARVHRCALDQVQFHELARPRTAARIVAGVLALEHLGVDRITAGRVALGGGVIEIAHGRFPVPPPAVLELLTGFEIVGGPSLRELTTPSGAAVLAALAAPAISIPEMNLHAHGRGATVRHDGEQIVTVLIGDITQGAAS